MEIQRYDKNCLVGWHDIAKLVVVGTVGWTLKGILLGVRRARAVLEVDCHTWPTCMGRGGRERERASERARESKKEIAAAAAGGGGQEKYIFRAWSDLAL